MSITDDIRTNRFHDFTVRLDNGAISGGSLGTEGRALPRTAGVRQTDHAFWFGSNVFKLVRDPNEPGMKQYRNAVTHLWNFGTLPFYWGRYEPVEGEPMEAATMAAATWARENGLTTKGHPLCWHTVCADWLLQYDNDTILQKQIERVYREVGRFAGLIDMWDVINEVVIMPSFDKYDNAVTRIANHVGAVELTLQLFRTARQANPGATLLINDFNLSPDYEHLIEELLERDCPIDAIGLQSHQHKGYHGIEYTLDVIDRFSRFGKPLHFTETTILSGHPVPPQIVDLNDYQIDEWPSTPELEERQAEQVAQYYSAIYSRPETAAIVWWDLQDGNWLGAPSGLLRRDMSPKPAYDRLHSLIKGEWWLDKQEVPVGPDGAVRFTGTAGTYEIEIDGTVRSVELGRDATAAAV
ncbi:MAG: endo-1,4-beta-xylanase [Spirochaetota bacterium]